MKWCSRSKNSKNKKSWKLKNLSVSLTRRTSWKNTMSRKNKNWSSAWTKQAKSANKKCLRRLKSTSKTRWNRSNTISRWRIRRCKSWSSRTKRIRDANRRTRKCRSARTMKWYVRMRKRRDSTRWNKNRSLLNVRRYWSKSTNAFNWLSSSKNLKMISNVKNLCLRVRTSSVVNPWNKKCRWASLTPTSA